MLTRFVLPVFVLASQVVSVAPDSQPRPCCNAPLCAYEPILARLGPRCPNCSNAWPASLPLQRSLVRSSSHPRVWFASVVSGTPMILPASLMAKAKALRIGGNLILLVWWSLHGPLPTDSSAAHSITVMSPVGLTRTPAHIQSFASLHCR